MKRQEIMEIGDERLIWTCVEPVIQKVRGKSGLEKLQVFRQLGDGQRALFMFQVLHGHMEHGTNGFYDQISYLAEQMNIWPALKSGMRYFGLDGMHDLIGKMEEDYSCRADGYADMAIMEKLDDMYRKLIPASVKSVAERIRSHPEEFLSVED
jgi:hypothetical protein